MEANVVVFYADAHGELHYSELNEEGKRAAASPNAEIPDYWTRPKQITVIQAVVILMKLMRAKLILPVAKNGGA